MSFSLKFTMMLILIFFKSSKWKPSSLTQPWFSRDCHTYAPALSIGRPAAWPSPIAQGTPTSYRCHFLPVPSPSGAFLRNRIAFLPLRVTLSRLPSPGCDNRLHLSTPCLVFFATSPFSSFLSLVLFVMTNSLMKLWLQTQLSALE